MQLTYVYLKDSNKYHVTFDDPVNDIWSWALCGVEFFHGAGSIDATTDNVGLVTREVDPHEFMCGNCKKVLESLKRQIDPLLGDA